MLKQKQTNLGSSRSPFNIFLTIPYQDVYILVVTLPSFILTGIGSQNDVNRIESFKVRK
jgi:hypothetical protein